jgi:hypothetical protein
MADAERSRLQEAHEEKQAWYRWGPYLSERQWGTVRGVRFIFLRRLLAFLGGVAILPGGQDYAGRQALHIPFPGTCQRLVKVVDIDDLVALR